MKNPDLSARRGFGNPPAAAPAIYRSQLFRTGTEATWASFFDRVGWRWTYAPSIISGWLPDFAIGCELQLPCVCADFPVGEDAKGNRTAERLHRAIEAVGDGNFLLLAQRPLTEDVSVAVGMLYVTKPAQQFRPAYLSRDEWSNDDLDFVVSRGPYVGAMSGRSFDHCNEGIRPFVTWGEVGPIWTKAAQRVSVLRGRR